MSAIGLNTPKNKNYDLYLSTVCVATRNDMRSPGVISCLDINIPPTNSVPRTIPEIEIKTVNF